MALAHEGKYSFINGGGTKTHGPGGRRGLDFEHVDKHVAPRSQSLSSFGVPAGCSPWLRNHLGHHSNYTDLRSFQNARSDPPPAMPHAWRAGVRDANKARLKDTWQQPERLKPEMLPAAGNKQENTNMLSHVDTLVFGIDVDGSDGVWKQSEAQIYSGAAGCNGRLERIPIYGDVPPVCLRTHGPDGTTSWENPRGSFVRLDPRKDYVA